MGVYTGENFFLNIKMGKSNKENAQIWSEKGANQANQVHTFKVPSKSHSVL